LVKGERGEAVIVKSLTKHALFREGGVFQRGLLDMFSGGRRETTVMLRQPIWMVEKRVANGRFNN